MKDQFITIDSISQIHESLGLPNPKHPLISLIDAAQFSLPEELVGVKMINQLYMISLKDKSCGMQYGRNSFDFNEGVMAFTNPHQVSSSTEIVQTGEIKGWMLFFHPDLIRGSHLAKMMDDFSFFNYEVFEALHLSEEEEQVVNNCAKAIQNEYEQRIDDHSQRVIISNIELLLNHSLRFYERQFNTRKTFHLDFVNAFQKELKNFFKEEKHLSEGIPSVSYFAEKANLSPNYFSDLLKKETGSSAKDHINEHVVERAKDLLVGSSKAVSEIAYDLGFNYPHYFTRLFKSKTGKTPIEYRNLN